MEDIFKRFLYTGVGFVALTAEKLQESIDDMVGKGKISEEEGKKLVDDFMDSTESRKDEFERKLREAAESVFDSLSFPTKTEYEALLKRVADLEEKLSQATQKKTTTRKRSTKKKTE